MKRGSALLISTVVFTAFSAPAAYSQKSASIAAFKASPPVVQNLPSVTGTASPCTGGFAAGYPCHDVDLSAFLSLADLSASAANDIWGWTDPVTSHEYALVGLNNGTAFVDVTDPVNPVYLGKLPTHTYNSSWRDIKVYADHAFVVSEASGHGVQVFDLTQLRTATPVTIFSETTHYSDVNDVHNIAINEASGFAYTVGNNGGGTTCGSGLHAIDITTPTSPTFAGCFAEDGYTHDVQCVIYAGPDLAHQGKEICVALNEDTITIVDMTNKSAPVQLGRAGYPGSSYVHQGWFDDQHVYFYEDDETDSGNTRTLIWDLADLDDPVLASNFYSTLSTNDHNQYVVGNRLYQANYKAGLRILDITDRENPTEIAHFDTYTPDNNGGYSGAWSNYPYFASGTIVVSSIGEGLFILEHNPGDPPPTPSEMYVDDIVLGTQGGKKRKRGSATVTVRDDLGNPAAGVLVTGSFSGAFDEVGSGTTDASGQTTIVTSTQQRNPAFDFCVSDAQGALPYNEAANTDPGFACGTGGGETPTSVHVAFIETGHELASQGAKRGKADVTIVNDLGEAVSGAVVNGTFSGDFNEGADATTNSNGVATVTTSGTKKGSVSVSFCVNTVSASLPYVSTDNPVPGYDCSTAKSPITETSIESLPESFALDQNYPNPFNPSTVISYSVPDAVHVTLRVYDMMGREMATLVDGYREAATHRVNFDASKLSAGTFLYVMKAGAYSETRRMTLLK